MKDDMQKNNELNISGYIKGQALENSIDSVNCRINFPKIIKKVHIKIIENA